MYISRAVGARLRRIQSENTGLPVFLAIKPLPEPPVQVIDNAQSSGVVKETLAGTYYAVICTKDRDLVVGHPSKSKNAASPHIFSYRSYRRFAPSVTFGSV
jgi:hypothetical protein